MAVVVLETFCRKAKNVYLLSFGQLYLWEKTNFKVDFHKLIIQLSTYNLVEP